MRISAGLHNASGCILPSIKFSDFLPGPKHRFVIFIFIDKMK